VCGAAGRQDGRTAGRQDGMHKLEKPLRQIHTWGGMPGEINNSSVTAWLRFANVDSGKH